MKLALRLQMGLVIVGVIPTLSQALDLTDAEQAWIKAHPVVRIAADPYWKPIEYVENGRQRGLASEYLSEISRRTGLHFELVGESGWGQVTQKLARGELDVLPATLRAFTTPSVAAQVTFTHSYYVGNTLIITREREPVIFDLHSLHGQTVALKGGGAYQATVQALYPDIRILPARTTEDALEAVAEGRAEAALGASAAVLPYLRRKYLGVLSISGVAGNLPMELAMGVRNDLPVLHSIMDKALTSLSARETDQMAEHWFESTDYGAPSLTVMLRHYWPQLTLALLSLLLVSGFAWHARRQHRRAVRSEKEKSMFLAVLSHEIRSPMNAILAAMELLQQHDMPQQAQRLLGVANSSSENLLRLLDDVLDISKLEAGRLQLDLAPVDIMELASSVADLLVFKANEKGIALEKIEEGPITRRLMLDRLRVGQIMHNLVSNAIKFTQWGRVQLGIRYEPSSDLPSKGTLHITVADTGIGMDDATRQQLFKPYAQASAATARAFGGTGLGLAICRQLVELMQGHIQIESQPGQGTTVLVQLPCASHAAMLSAVNKAAPFSMPLVATRSDSENCPKVLLVEDTPVNQVVLQAQLEALGCVSMLAENGQAALLLLARQDFDIVLLDCDLPDISGYQVAKNWREYESTGGISPTPILAISASTDTKHTAACFEAGMDGVLKKPIKLGKLRDALQLWTEIELDEGDSVQVEALGPEMVMESLRNDLDALRLTWEERDIELATHHAHRLVGALAILEAVEMAHVSHTIEVRLKQREVVAPQEIDDLIAKLSELLVTWDRGSAN